MTFEMPEGMTARDVTFNGSEFTVTSVAGNLIADRCAKIETAFLRLLSQGRTRVVLDGEALTYVSSTGFGLILHVSQLLRDRGGDLKLANVSPAVARSLRILNLGRFLDAWPSLEDAYFAFQRDAARRTPAPALVAA